jgi:LacI family transcriptional regulator, repressor for deo operon, udp, cdd, tsx, nupC, and nupG
MTLADRKRTEDMKSGPLSIKDIARAANVSHSTVSRALRGSPLVNAATADRIRRIASAANFRVSSVGRSLATGRTFAIGVLVANVADPFSAEVVSSIEEVANEKGYSLILASSKFDPTREIKELQAFEEHRVDGILVVASCLGKSNQKLFRNPQMPMVLLNNQFAGEAGYSVNIDNIEASQIAVGFLIQLGHRRIGYIAHRYRFQVDAARHLGYRQALEAFGLPYDPELVAQGDSEPEHGMNAMDQLLSLQDRPTAVFCYNDLTAFGAMKAVQARGLRIPEDFSVVGFDDLVFASYTTPALTTVRQPKHQMGRVATEMLLRLIDGSKFEARRSLHSELVVRGSTGSRPQAL